MKGARETHRHDTNHSPQPDAFASDDGFAGAALHSITRTVPRGDLRQRLVPWTLAIIITLGVAAAGTGLALGQPWLMGPALAVVLALALYGAKQHAWRASTRYKRPLEAPVDQRHDDGH